MHAIVSTETDFDEQPAVWALGVTSFKHFFNAYRARPGEELSWLGGPSDAGMVFRSLRFCAGRGTPGVVIVHCEDNLIIHLEALVKRRAGGTSAPGATRGRTRPSPRAGRWPSSWRGRPVRRSAWRTGPLQRRPTSSTETADLAAAARARGEAVWAEVTPHHLTHTGGMEAEIGCWGKVNPPLRAPRDTERLWRPFHDGVITCLGSDHGTGGRTRTTTEKGGATSTTSAGDEGWAAI
jgi:dihydroorotase-like cyclic amidohydrolase